MKNCLQQFADRAVFFHGVTQMRFSIDKVVVAPAFLGALENASLFEFADKSKSGPLRNTDPLGHIAKPRIRIVSKTHQHVGIVAEEGPA